MKKLITCKECNGNGGFSERVDDSHQCNRWHTCKHCKGSGKMSVSEPDVLQSGDNI